MTNNVIGPNTYTEQLAVFFNMEIASTKTNRL